MHMYLDLITKYYIFIHLINMCLVPSGHTYVKVQNKVIGFFFFKYLFVTDLTAAK